MRNKVSKSKQSLSDCFGKLIAASQYACQSCGAEERAFCFLAFQLRFQTAGYLAWVCENRARESRDATHEIFLVSVETASTRLSPRNHNRSAAKPVLFS